MASRPDPRRASFAFALVALAIGAISLALPVHAEGDPGAASGATPVTSEPGEIAATYHDLPSPLTFKVERNGKSATDRAREATQALTAAINEFEGGGVPPVRVAQTEFEVAVHVGAVMVAELGKADAIAAGIPFAELGPRLEAEMKVFVPAQVRRKSLQNFALHFFLSVFILVMAFVSVRGIRSAFDRWDTVLEERRGTLNSISILRIPVISGEAFGGALAFGLSIGRFAAYATAIVASGAFVLSQFELTRPLLRRVGRLAAQPVLQGIESVVSALPGIFLALVLLISAQAALRVLDLLLDGVAAKKIHWRRLPPERVPVARLLGPVLLAAVLLPLIVAMAFGRFGTPLETLALAVVGAGLLAGTPVGASFAVGVILMWIRPVAPGDWVRVGDVSGEVIRCTFLEIQLVPEGGGTIAVPTLLLLTRPVHRLGAHPAVGITVRLATDDASARHLLVKLREVVRPVEPDARADVRRVGGGYIEILVTAPAVRGGIQEALMLAISDAADAGELPLIETGEAT